MDKNIYCPILTISFFSIYISCLAVNDLLRGRPLDDVVDQLPELWETCLRVRDDIKVFEYSSIWNVDRL